MGISPLKIQLVLQEGQPNRIPIGKTRSLANFHFIVYSDDTTTMNMTGSTINDGQQGTVNSGESSFDLILFRLSDFVEL